MTRRVALIASASALLLALIGAGVASAYYHPGNLGARTQVTALVPTYKSQTSTCTVANTRSHASPLPFGSCTPPIVNATRVVTGTNTVSQGTSNITLSVVCQPPAPSTAVPPCSTTAGDNEDVRISTNSSDVRCKTNTAVTGHCPTPANTNGTNDYNGQVVGTSSIRITDSNNGPAGTTTGGTTAATVTDIPFSVGIQCAASASTTIGGTCNAVTSADAIFPGFPGKTVVEGKKGVVQIGQIQVFDTGSDGVGTANPLPGAGACPPACIVNAGTDVLSFEEGLYLP